MRTHGRVRRSAVAVSLVAGCLTWLTCAVLAAAPASAHAELTAATPAQDATVTSLPARVSLTFSEPVVRPVAVVVTGPTGETVTEGSPRVQGGTVTQPLRDTAAPGRYTTSYRAVSDDGHAVSGVITFTVGKVAAAGQAIGAPAEQDGTGIDTGLLAWLVGGVLAALAVCAIAVTRLVRGHDD